MSIRGTIQLPGDKSISHRALMMSAWSSGINHIRNLSTGLDVLSTRNCLEACGMEISGDHHNLEIQSNKLSSPTNALYCGNSGTTARLLSGLLAGQACSAKLTGDKSLQSRPMARIIDPLVKMGVQIQSDNSRLPLSLSGQTISGIRYRQQHASAQVKSCLMLAALGADGETVITEPVLSRDHTERFFDLMELPYHRNGLDLHLTKFDSSAAPYFLTIPGDPSTAAFFLAAAVLSENSELVIPNLLANPTRTGFIDVLQQMGADLEWQDVRTDNWEPVGTIFCRSSRLSAIELDSADIPAIIDEIPILALLATKAEGQTIIRGAGELRVKESDRIKSICQNLKLIGADVNELEDGLIISGPTAWQDAEVDSFGDHRIAMTFEIANLVSNANINVTNRDCIAISSPEFDLLLNQISK